MVRINCVKLGNRRTLWLTIVSQVHVFVAQLQLLVAPPLPRDQDRCEPGRLHPTVQLILLRHAGFPRWRQPRRSLGAHQTNCPDQHAQFGQIMARRDRHQLHIRPHRIQKCLRRSNRCRLANISLLAKPLSRGRGGQRETWWQDPTFVDQDGGCLNWCFGIQRGTTCRNTIPRCKALKRGLDIESQPRYRHRISVGRLALCCNRLEAR